VREIQPRNVHAGAHQVRDHLLGVAGRTNGTDDFCSAHTFGSFFGRGGAGWQASLKQVWVAFLQVAAPFFLSFSSFSLDGSANLLEPALVLVASIV
jgi:hypothetical protein